MSVRSLKIKDLGVQSYTPIWQKMKAFTEIRDAESDDEIWFVEHPAVFTQGQAGKAEHVIAPGDIPVVKTDRGGQVTYHGPGQVVAYTLIDIRRLGLGVRDLVTAIESTIVQYLATLDITGAPDPKAPGVYVDKAKIAALGLRVRRGCAYHGLSLNVAMDLSPFERINPCGYEGLAVTSLEKLGARLERQVVVRDLAGLLAHQFGYDAPPIERGN